MAAYATMAVMDFDEKLQDAGFVNMRDNSSGIICDIKYATTDNLTGEVLYSSPACYVRKPVAEALTSVQHALQELGMSLKIWDAYRPISVQKKLVSFVNNTDYTPNVSNHSRGIAVDVTLIDPETGIDVVMPTEYDDLSELAHSDAKVADPVAFRNRELLETVMRTHGFTVYPYEWWHFDYLSMADAEPLEIQI